MSAADNKIHLGVLAPQRPSVIQELERSGFALHMAVSRQDWIENLAPHAGMIRGVLSSGMAGITRELIETLPNLEICVNMGVGLETTDLVAAKAHDVVVTTTPVLFEDVADLSISLGMAAARRIPQGDRFVRAGSWLTGRAGPGRSFWGKRYGILGLGRIGSRVARRLEGFAGEIAFYDPAPKQSVSYRAAKSEVDLAGSVDILFLCAAGGPSGSPFIVTRAVLEALGPKGSFVNIARGWLVDEPAMVELLSNGKLGSAGLDVFHDEPKVPKALLDLENVVLTPHIASATEECQEAMTECFLENVKSWFRTGKAVTPVAV